MLYQHYEVNEQGNLLDNKEVKYLLLLLLKQFNCLDKERLKKQLDIKNSRSIEINLRKAEEKLLINKEFRQKYFYLEEKIEKKI